jgi:hypothetical protein
MINVYNSFCVASNTPLLEHNNQPAPSKTIVQLNENFLKGPGVDWSWPALAAAARPTIVDRWQLSGVGGRLAIVCVRRLVVLR